MNKLEVIVLVNSALRQEREINRLRSYSALAQHLGVNEATIYRWRTGQLPANADVIVPLVLRHLGYEHTTEGSNCDTSMAA